MSKVIVFSGIDGSGKSVHACRLAYELGSLGKSVRYVWMRGRGRVFLSLPLLALCQLLGITKVHRLKSGIKISAHPFYAYMPLRLIWPWLQLIDSLIATLLYVYVPSYFSTFLLIERGVIDSFVDAHVDVREPVGSGILQRLFLSLLPKKGLVVIFDVNEEIAMERKHDILNIDYLKARRKLYSALQKKYGWHLISTDKDFEHVHQDLTKAVEQYMGEHSIIAQESPGMPRPFREKNLR